MDIIKLYCYGEAYYSGATYREVVYLLKEDYRELNLGDLTEEEVYIGELDGKYSEIYGDIFISEIKEGEQENYNFETVDDGDCLFCHLIELGRDKGIEEEVIEKMIRRAYDYIENIDSLVDVTYRVRKSQVKYLDRVYNDLEY